MGNCGTGADPVSEIKPETIDESIRAHNFEKGKELIQYLRMYNVSPLKTQRTNYHDSFLNFEIMMFTYNLDPIQKDGQAVPGVADTEENELHVAYLSPHAASFANSPKGIQVASHLSSKSPSLNSGQMIVTFNLSNLNISGLPHQNTIWTGAEEGLLDHFNDILLEQIGSNKGASMVPMQQFNPKMHYYSRDPTVYSIIPGDLTPPWISQALGVLLERPEMLKPFYLVNKATETSVCVPLCLQGVWRKLAVEPRLLVSRDNLRPLLSLTAAAEVWPHYLEKAYFMSLRRPSDMYRRTRAIPYAVKDLTGSPYQEIFFKATCLRSRDLETILERYLARQFVVCFAIDADFGFDPVHGLYTGTVYNLTKVARLTHSKKNLYSMRLSWSPGHEPPCFLRNRTEVVAYSDWNATEINTSGSFFVSVDDLYEYFDVMQVYHFMPMYQQLSVVIESVPNPFSFMEVDIVAGCNVYMQLSQEESLEGDASVNQNGLRLLGIAVFQRKKTAEDNKVFMVFQNAIAERDNWVAIYLEPGNYFLMVALGNQITALGNSQSKTKSKVSLNLSASGTLSLYEVSEPYFRRKLPCKLPEGDLGLYYLISSQIVNQASLLDFAVVSQRLGLRRWSKIGSNIVSPIIYRNFGKRPVEVELTILKNANLRIAELNTDLNSGVTEYTASQPIRFELAPNEAKELFAIHISASLELKIRERATFK